ncbi:MAG: hypothetical protein R2750_12355 [Bacteroidales bacterium]
MNKNTLSGIAIAVLLMIIAPVLGFAQLGKVEITPFGGYQFGGKIQFYEGEFKIENAANYGVAVDVEVARDTKLEVFWSQMNTSAKFNPYYNYEYLGSNPFDVNVGYIQIGSVREMDLDNVRPFGAFTLGTTYFIPKSSSGTVTYDDEWVFSVTLGGGAKIMFSDRIGIRLQGRMMLPMFWGGAGFTVGTGGAGFTVGAGTSMIQGDFTGGLIIALGD